MVARVVERAQVLFRGVTSFSSRKIKRDDTLVSEFNSKFGLSERSTFVAVA